jgi:integrase-like protein
MMHSRHTFATDMARAGVSLPVLMKLLGHTNPEMTMRYIEVVGSDLQREFHLARTQPRHLAPQPRVAAAPATPGLQGIIESLLGSQHLMEMLRRSLSPGATTRGLERLSNRLIKIIAEVRKLPAAE